MNFVTPASHRQGRIETNIVGFKVLGKGVDWGMWVETVRDGAIRWVMGGEGGVEI